MQIPRDAQRAIQCDHGGRHGAVRVAVMAEAVVAVPAVAGEQVEAWRRGPDELCGVPGARPAVVAERLVDDDVGAGAERHRSACAAVRPARDQACAGGVDDEQVERVVGGEVGGEAPRQRGERQIAAAGGAVARRRRDVGQRGQPASADGQPGAARATIASGEDAGNDDVRVVGEPITVLVAIGGQQDGLVAPRREAQQDGAHRAASDHGRRSRASTGRASGGRVRYTRGRMATTPLRRADLLADQAAHPPFGHRRFTADDPPVRVGATGTGADLLLLAWSATDLAAEIAAGTRVLGRLGVRPGMRVANTLPGALVTPGALLLGDVNEAIGALDVPLGTADTDGAAKAAWELVDRVQCEVLVLAAETAATFLAAAPRRRGRGCRASSGSRGRAAAQGRSCPKTSRAGSVRGWRCRRWRASPRRRAPAACCMRTPGWAPTWCRASSCWCRRRLRRRRAPTRRASPRESVRCPCGGDGAAFEALLDGPA